VCTTTGTSTSTATTTSTSTGCAAALACCNALGTVAGGGAGLVQQCQQAMAAAGQTDAVCNQVLRAYQSAGYCP
jgi:hypothetical protein